jgi:hypothetical protein
MRLAVLWAVLLSACARAPFDSHYAVYGHYVPAGYVDLQPGMRLKVVKPVVANGEPLKTAIAQQEGLNLTVRSNVIGVETKFLEPAQVGFAADVTHYRLFFLARDLDRGRRITLIGAHSREELNAATASLDAYCERPGSPCLAVSDGMVIGAQIPVKVQGRQDYVPLGASVGEAVPRGVDAKRVRLARKGERVPASQVLELALNGGDSISW